MFYQHGDLYVSMYDVVDRLEVVEESCPVENVEWDEGEREQESRDGVDLADTVHLAGNTCQRLHAIVAASPSGRPGTQTLGHRRPDTAAALTASPQPRRTAGRRRRHGIRLSAALGGSGQHRRLRLSVDILRRSQSALNRFVSGATVAWLCRALFDFLQCIFIRRVNITNTDSFGAVGARRRRSQAFFGCRRPSPRPHRGARITSKFAHANFRSWCYMCFAF